MFSHPQFLAPEAEYRREQAQRLAQSSRLRRELKRHRKRR